MYSVEDILQRSISRNEIVVGFMDAMELIHICEQRAVRVLGWEGWLVYPNGTRTHSLRHQGTADLSSMPLASTHALTRATIMQAHTEWEALPESPNADLYFCITLGSNL